MSEDKFSSKAMRVAIVSCTDGEKSQHDSFKTFHTSRKKSATDFHKDILATAMKFKEQMSNESTGVICRRQRDSCEIISTGELTQLTEMEQLRSHFMKNDFRSTFTKSNSFSGSNSSSFSSSSNSSNGSSFSLVSRRNLITGIVE